MSPERATAGRWVDVGRRCRAAVRAAGARWQLAADRRRTARALAALGTAVSRSAEPLADAGACAARTEVARLDARLAGLEQALATSLDEDRRDYADASSWLRPVAILRGVATRALVRDRLWRCRRERATRFRLLGAAVVEARLPAPGGADAVHLAARRAYDREARHAERLDRLLQEAGARAVPAVARHAGREVVALGRPVAQEVRARLLPRLPALAGMAVGWWVAGTFTDSRFRATLHAIGIGSGPRRAVNTTTLHAMEFWLPVLAAALCSYASGRIGALVRARYAPPPEPARAEDDGSPPGRR